MLVVGLTGGIGSGKTTVSNIFKEEGAYIIEADQIARELVKPQSEAWKEIVKLFGNEILKSDGSVDRRKLAKEVFSNPEKIKSLNRILHPKIKREFRRRIEEIKKKDKNAIVIFDAPLLIETGTHKEMDRVIVVTSDENQQLERVKKRDSKTEEEIRNILYSQIPIDRKLEVADFVIRNEGSLDETDRMAREVYRKLKDISN